MNFSGGVFVGIMEPETSIKILLFLHLFLYLPATVLLVRVLSKQVRRRSGSCQAAIDKKASPAFFLATVAMLLLAALFLAYGVLLVGNRDYLLPFHFQQAVEFGSVLYWFLLTCFIARWGRCFG